MFLERDEELGLLSDRVAQLAGSGGKVVLIRGEAGIGKSALVREFLESVRTSAHVHVGFCDDLQTPQPYGPLWDIGREAPGLREALEDRDRQGVLEACFELLSIRLRPNLMVVEDTHWADGATLDAIKYVGRRIGRTNGLLLMTYRDGEVDDHHPLRRVISDLAPGDVVRVPLRGLSAAAVSEIVEGSGLDPDQVMETTRGNPFLVTEMASASAEEVPSSIRDSVLARLSRLSAGSQNVLRTLAVIPRRISVADLSGVSGASLDNLAECERLNLITVEGEVVSFRHELIRRAIEASLTISETIAFHRAILEAIRADADPAWLVHHATGCNDLGRIVALAPEAARAAQQVGSHREAAAHFRSLDPHLERFDLQTRGDILFDWARVEHYLENPASIEILDRAIQIYRDSGSVASLARALSLGVDLNRAYGRLAAARAHAVEAVEILAPGPASAELAHALAAHAWLLIHVGEIDDAEAVGKQATATAEITGAEAALTSALGVEGVLRYVRGLPGGLDLLGECRRRAQDGGHRYQEVSSLLRMAVVALEMRDIARAVDFAAQARATAGRYELPILETEAMAINCEALLWSGEWAEAEDLATEALGRHSKTDVHLSAVVGVLRTRTGRSGGGTYIEKSWSMATDSDEIDDLLISGAALVERGWIHPQSDPSPLEPMLDLLERGIKAEYPWPAGALALWLWKTGALEQIPNGVPVPYRDLFVGRVDQAAGFWESRKIPYAQAIALGSGSTAQRVHSLEILEGLGAAAVASKLRRELRAEGVSMSRGKGRATRSNRAGLTARQAEVLVLVGQGLSNSEIADRLFVSPRTAENHVSAILAKLGAADREQAVSTARREGVLTIQ